MRVIVAAIGATALLTLAACERGMGPRAGKFDGESALRYAKAQVDFGTRIPGTPGAQKAASIHYDRLAKVPGVEGIWQGHRSLLDPDHNTAEEMIANLEDTAQCQGHWLKASVSRDGTFTVTNGRNQYSRTYKP